MTLLAPQPRPKNDTSADRKLRPADPGRVDRRGTMPAGTVLVVMVGALVIAALLNAGPMLERAETSELGTGRDLRLAFWEPIEEFSSTLGLHVPRAALDALADGDGATRSGVDVVAGGEPRGQLGHEPLDIAPAGPAADPDPDPDDGGQAGSTHRPEVVGPVLPASSSPTRIPLGFPGLDEPAEAGQTGGGSIDGDPATSSAGTGSAAEERARDAGGETASGEAAPEVTTGDAPDASPFPLRRPTADDPLEMLIVGDSTMDAVGTSMLRELSTTGVTDAILDFRVSTGLSRPDFFDWPAHLRELRASQGTEIIVIMIGANDAQPILIDGEVEQHGTERWSAAYRQRVAALLDELTGDGGWVIWIGQPVMRNDPYDARLRGLNQIYAEETARYPSAVYVDPRPVTSDQDGGYTAYLPDADGNQELIRQTDGVHLTSDGGDRISPFVVEEINRIAPLY